MAQVSLPVSNAKIFLHLEAQEAPLPRTGLVGGHRLWKNLLVQCVGARDVYFWGSVGEGGSRYTIPYQYLWRVLKWHAQGCWVCIYIYIYYMIIYVCIYIFVLSYYRKIIKSKWSINDLLGSTVVVLRLLLVVTFYYDIHAYMCVFMISCYSTIESVLRCCCSCNIIYVHMRSTTTIILICQCHLVPWTLLILWRPEI